METVKVYFFHLIPQNGAGSECPPKSERAKRRREHKAKSLDDLVKKVKVHNPDFSLLPGDPVRVTVENLQKKNLFGGLTIVTDAEGNMEFAFVRKPDAFCRKEGRRVAATKLVRRHYSIKNGKISEFAQREEITGETIKITLDKTHIYFRKKVGKNWEEVPNLGKNAMDI